ncbi:DUF4175 domain-containing protein [Hymenobacter sp. 5414T-23]|uniref:DUF4175 domain-containing protein n=1 Tax=Hymenobacter sp. 5414T-23 TaxID=2932252 RepID=UPI001FD4880C|nr:DUF4175 domain-containing protein [Hymenobacter sp. 5414T-23]UOQ80861.1 DUF4175 domain-containing protein [Hymenobacter sp. 5414T-23]
MNTVATSSVSEAPALLRNLRQGWLLRRALALLLPAVMSLLVLGVLVAYWPGLRWPAGAGILLLFGWLVWQLFRLFQTDLPAVTRHLDRRFLELEDSAGLLLQPSSELNLLAGFQQQRVADRLQALRTTTEGPLLPVGFRRPALLAAALGLVAAGLWWYRPTTSAIPVAAPALQLHFDEAPAAPAQPAPARVVSTQIKITPPAYTRRAAYAAAQPSFQCPQDSRVRWEVRVSRAADAPPVLELGTRRVPMQAATGRPTVFFAELPVPASVLYRIRFAGRPSDDYAIEVQPDQAPVLRVVRPKAYTLVEFGRPPQVAVEVAARDDYGLTRARLVATVAQGQGEAVKFKEVVSDLSAALKGQPTQATLRHQLRLPNLGLTYGDEVYFYVQAWDNHQHMTRTDTYLVQWEDTTVQESTLDVSMGVKSAPAYFRSQRQIIIDTEKLLAEQPRLSAATLLERSNAIGFDQKILRMRYGKFLGEEAEGNIGATAHAPTAEPEEELGLGSVVAEDHTPQEKPAAATTEEHHDQDGHDHGHAPANPNATASEARTAELMEPYMHRHDDSETADFLEPAVKAKLQAVLSQMWDAELRLRTGRPKEALPYEYRALRLLKQVQQQTRAYVKKAGFTPPPMPEATTRLTGDLAGAEAPRRQQQAAIPPSYPTVRAALRVLGQLRLGQPAGAGTAAALDQAGSELARAALQQPGRYLVALRALRETSAAVRAGRPLPTAALPLAERGLTDLLPLAAPTPQRTAGTTRLARRYFQELGQ